MPPKTSMRRVMGVDPKDPENLKDFRGALNKVLLKGFLSPGFITSFLDEYMGEFVTAFTHKSVSSSVNMEVYEALGDTVVNACIMRYINSKYPTIVSVEWLTKLKHLYQSTAWLYRVAQVLGFLDWVRCDEEDFQVFAQFPYYEALQAYRSIYEDTTEAFFGCFLSCFTKAGYSFGAALQISYYVIWWAFEEIGIDISYERVYDPVTRLKAAMTLKGGAIESLEGQRWDFDVSGSEFKDTSGTVPMYTYTYYGWVISRGGQRGKKETVIGQASAPEDSLAKQTAALRALDNLRTYYESKGKVWYEPRRDPYESDHAWKGFLGNKRQARLREEGAEEVHYVKKAPAPRVNYTWLTDQVPGVVPVVGPPTEDWMGIGSAPRRPIPSAPKAKGGPKVAPKGREGPPKPAAKAGFVPSAAKGARIFVRAVNPGDMA